MAKRRLGLFSLCGLGLSAVAAGAQTNDWVPQKVPCPPTIFAPGAQGTTTAPLQATPAPQADQTPAATTAEPTAPTPSTPSAPQPAAAPQADAAPAAPSLDLGGGVALGESTVALALPGYIDNPVPMNRVRLRYDYSSNNPFPDRGEFFYPKCGCFANPLAGQFFDPRAKGPPLPERSVDSQDVELMVERTVGSRASVFVETPFRFINPEQNSNEFGISDIKLGAKYAVIATQRTFLTAQIRVGLPTGDGRRGLGNEVISYEPALLLTQQIGCRSFFHAEFRGWFPTEGSDFAADILRYGVGYSYLAVDRPNFTVLPITELVGWNLLNGRKSGVQGPPLDATGDTIVNGKVGVRFGFGDRLPLGQNTSQLFVGYGRALTGERWYEEIFRVEYQINY